MATTGTALLPGASTLPGTGTIPGQGPFPVLWLLYATDDASASIPTWTDATAKARGFSVERGRTDEQGDFDTGTATLALDARDRTFDPNSNTALKPLNRWWLREGFSGEMQDMFKGYALRYQLAYPDAGTDSICAVECADEFMVLARAGLPVTDPPREAYADVITSENPNCYWSFDYANANTPFAAVVGPALVPVNGFGLSSASGAVAGDSALIFSYLKGATTAYLQTSDILTSGQGGDVSGLSAFAVETWYNPTNLTNAAGDLIKGPTAGAASTWRLFMNASGIVTIEARNSAGTLFTAAATSPIPTNTWTHIVGTLTGGNLLLYINGTQVASTAWTGSFAATLDANAFLRVADPASTDASAGWDEIAVYRAGLSASRILAHYTAAGRGFAAGDGSALRAGKILDTIRSQAPRNLNGTRNMTGLRMFGQTALDPLRDCQTAELADGMLFIGRDGSIVLLATGHQGVVPWQTVQATFGEDQVGNELPYLDIGLDYSETFLTNEYNVTGGNGVLTTTSDATSISRYFKRSKTLTLPTTDPLVTGTVASALLAKYKDPINRVISISPNMADANTIQAVFQRELGDRIRILRRPLGGGAAIDQSPWIQKIQISGGPDRIWDVTWGVSPL